MNITDYKGKNILAWLFFNENYEDPNGGVNKVCYVYPRVLMKDSSYDLISSNDFPTVGRIEVRIQGGESAEDVYSRLGSLVKIRINKTPEPYFQANNIYRLKFNPQYERSKSEIWLEAFSGGPFYQVVDVNLDIKTIQNDGSISEPDYPIWTNQILLRYGNKFYGPFEYDIKDGTIALHGVKDYQYIVGEYDAIDYNDDLLVIGDQNNEEAVLLIPKSSIPSSRSCVVCYDWISKDVLIDSFIDSLRSKNSYTKAQIRQLKDMAHQLIESGDGVQFTKERISKVKNLLESITQKEEYEKEIVEYALENEKTRKTLAEEAVKNYFDKIQNNISEIASVQKFIEDLRNQKASLENKIFSLTEEINERENGNITKRALSAEIESEKIADLQEKIENLRDRLSENRKEKETMLEKINLQKSIDDFKTEIEQLKQERDKAKANYNQQLLDNNDLEKQFKRTLEEFNDKAKQTARIIDSKLLDKILRGVDEDSVEKEIVPFDTSLLCREHLHERELIDRVTAFVRDSAHRDIAPNDVTNYLICMTQGFITTFAGEPGTGKTSLCNILAKALGLDVAIPQRRFIDVSVERGWSSHKDFIGYYNPLSKKMERSNGEVFAAFERLDEEYHCDPSKIAPFIILLDEANLSPIEHYWAAFLKLCDFTSSTNRSISLGGSRSFKIPDHLRFLATVNFDHTTEELSPRFLDRSWIIMLEPSRIGDEIEEAEDEVKNQKDMVSFQDLANAFNVHKDDLIDEAIQNKWNAVQRIFKEHSLQIMPRNLIMVRNYCAVGCRCMERDTPSTKLAPLDYAIAQKVLPALNGTGENYRMLIEDLSKECTTQNMPITARHLERIKRVAENNMGFYQFFAR